MRALEWPIQLTWASSWATDVGWRFVQFDFCIANKKFFVWNRALLLLLCHNSKFQLGPAMPMFIRSWQNYWCKIVFTIPSFLPLLCSCLRQCRICLNITGGSDGHNSIFKIVFYFQNRKYYFILYFSKYVWKLFYFSVFKIISKSILDNSKYFSKYFSKFI